MSIITLKRYNVQLLPLEDIHPSPENDEIYGKIEEDEQFEALVSSIEKRGLEDPILITEDHFIVSGHRRYHVLKWLEITEAPCRIIDERREGNDSYRALLAEYNPQRVKTVGSLLKETLLRDKSGGDTYEAIQEYNAASAYVDADFMTVSGVKWVEPITDKKLPFLGAVKLVIDDMQSYWPLSIRQIHYQLLNKPPLTSTPKRSKFIAERYRYKNNRKSYNALVRLLRSARYGGHVPMTCIDDPTRPQVTHWGYENVSDFVESEISGFLTGYKRHRQEAQPRHIEVFGEKNTLKGLLERACNQYHIPLSIGRGFCSVPVWRDIAGRFRKSGRERMTLIIVSDYDPEGFELADDAIRSLRDLWGIPLDGHRVAVNREQIEELNLSEDFNPAKESSSQFSKFVERTGGKHSWEVESLPPAYLIDQVKAAIEENMDMEIYGRLLESEEEDADELYHAKQEMATSLRL